MCVCFLFDLLIASLVGGREFGLFSLYLDPVFPISVFFFFHSLTGFDGEMSSID